jgi:hypothetical protein
MTPIAVAFKSKEALLSERAQLVAESGLPLDELKRRSATYDVSVEQRDIMDSIENIEFLLADA